MTVWPMLIVSVGWFAASRGEFAASCLVASGQAGGGGAAPATQEAAPLTEEQLTRLRELVRTTQETSSKLKRQLADRQQDLVKLYAEYELDEDKATKLEAEIVELQRQLLASYHKMQVELRGTVSKERFATLKRRLDRVLAPGSEAPNSERSTRKDGDR